MSIICKSTSFALDKNTPKRRWNSSKYGHNHIIISYILLCIILFIYIG